MTWIRAAAFIVLPAIASASSAADDCAIDSIVDLWALATCFQRNQTDDELNQGVVNCMEQWRMVRDDNECEEKKSLKADFCTFHMQRTNDYESVSACVADERVVPEVVERGGVGG